MPMVPELPTVTRSLHCLCNRRQTFCPLRIESSKSPELFSFGSAIAASVFCSLDCILTLVVALPLFRFAVDVDALSP